MVSDRRYCVALDILKANAWMAGRDTVKSSDLSVLEYICWNNDDDASHIKQILPEYMAPLSKEINIIMDDVYDCRKRVIEAADVQDDGTYNKSKVTDVAARCRATLKTLITQFDIVDAEAEDEEDALMVAQARDAATEVLDLISGLGTGKVKIGTLLDLDIYRAGA